MGKLNVLGVMAGNGTCLYPFRKHFNIIGNFELRGVFYDKKQEQWKANFPNVIQHREYKKYKKRIDVIIGHPDCGDSSVLRMSRAKKKGEVKDNNSIAGYLQAIVDHQPDYFLLENLPGFLDGYGKEALEGYLNDYNLIYHLSSVANYGNSQISRKRLVIIGVNKILGEKILKYFKLPEIDKSELKFAQEFEIGDNENQDICHVREPLNKTCNLYWGEERKITYAKAQRIWKGQYSTSARWYVGGKMNNQPGVSRHLPNTYPLTVRKQNRQFRTDGLVLSPREMARIQGVPKSFKLVYHPEQSIYWINKARLTVTKSMPVEIATWFRKCILRAQKTRL